MIWNALSVIALVLLAVAAPAAAQPTMSDRDLRNRPHSGGLSGDDRKRLDDLQADDARSNAAAASEGELRKKLLRLPPLPVERNGLLGSWRQEGGGQQGILGSEARTGGAMINELAAALLSNPDKLLPSRCVQQFGNGVTFAPSTYAIRAIDGSTLGGPIAYRSGGKQGIWIIPDGVVRTMPLEIAGPNRIVLGGSCALVRVGAPAANVAANAATAPNHARTGAANSSSATKSAEASTIPAAGAEAVVDGAGFRCGDGGLYHVTGCRGDASCELTELHRPLPAVGFHMPTRRPRAEIATRVQACESGGFRFAADGKPIFVK